MHTVLISIPTSPSLLPPMPSSPQQHDFVLIIFTYKFVYKLYKQIYGYLLLGPFSVAQMYMRLSDHLGLDNLSGTHP